MRPEVSEEGRNSCKMQTVSFQIQAKIELTNNTNKTLQQNIPKKATGFRGRSKELENVNSVISDLAQLQQKIEMIRALRGRQK